MNKNTMNQLTFLLKKDMLEKPKKIMKICWMNLKKMLKE